ncbi:MAG: V-type ATP synthase subunit A [Gammaproteobacteria bacterium]|nr:V-type ATP synthase subunit A [Gammaproteobacteria bacterium]MDH3560665.1 V-type ATP synthase subunit A [Gammaproteobacteria bacterium]
MKADSAAADAIITRISGPVLHARTRRSFQINEAVLVGGQRLLGEVIRIKGDEAVVQVYEDTTGLRPGTPLNGTGAPLSVRLGPGLLGNIFDGLLRPLTGQGSYVQPGVDQGHDQREFSFTPTVKPGEHVLAGAIIGTVACPDARPQHCLVPPSCQGEVISIVEAGEYSDRYTVCVLGGESGKTREIAMSHRWPVRQPRPVAARIPVEGPLFTGQRILDSIFPLACGGRAAMPGGFGTGKTILQETLAKWCDADVIIYVGCGERGNEMASVLEEFPALEDPRTGRRLMERTVIIANTSNMPVSARESSIYTAVTVAEFFRDQGMRVALMADSTSRWAEALREISGRLGELPGEAGYPAYLSSRLADFYERAAHVRTLNGQPGSLSIIGAVSPPSADFSEPVTTHTKRYVRSFWALDTGRAQARFYPAIHPLQSYSQDIDVLSQFWSQNGNPEWPEQRRRFLGLLEEQARLDRMARIVGKDALPPRQQHVLLCAELINEAFLRQSAFSEVDRYCSAARQMAMLKLLSYFIDKSEQAVAVQISVEDINTLNVMRRLRRMGEDIGNGELEKFDELRVTLDIELAQLTRRMASDAG